MQPTDEGQTDEQEPADADPRRRVVVGVLADPDLPASVARRLPDVLPGVLAQQVSDRVCWVVDAVCEPFEVMAPDTSRLIDKARARVRDTPWDLAIGLTDVPMRARGGVVLAEISNTGRVALISLPALGGLRLRRRTVHLVVAIVDWLTRDLTGRDADTPPDRPRLPRRIFAASHAHVLVPPDDGIGVEIITARRWGLPRLLAGVVRANRPWKLALGLSTALAGAFTGSAFGVLYSAVWQLGAALSPARLVSVTVGAIAALVFWLIVGHDLWERGSDRDRVGGTGLRNAGTVLTIGFGALMFFLALSAVTTIAAAVVIPPDYLASRIGRAVDWRSYLTVGLMASVLGTVAGAVGSGLEDDETVRRATYGYREQERWREVRRDQR